MSLFRSQRERVLWIRAGGTLLAIYASLYFVRDVVVWLRERNLLRVSVAAIFVAVALALVWRLARRGPGRWEWGAALAIGIVYLAAFLAVERTEERVHFIEYGAIGYLTHAALLERARAAKGPARPGWGPAVAAVALTSAAGWGDEGIQAVLPNRVYELGDVGLNAVAGVLAVAATALLGSARRLEAARAAGSASETPAGSEE